MHVLGTNGPEARTHVIVGGSTNIRVTLGGQFGLTPRGKVISPLAGNVPDSAESWGVASYLADHE